ncbi:MAG: hypothetical protein M3312_09010 [Actinomycetota bacterium]|nr:hypothetical protein [Actinomycetota bacterium]
MPGWAWVLIVIAAIVVLAAIAWALVRRRRSQLMRERYGPEYDRAVEERGRPREAEQELARREEKRQRLDIVPLSPEARDRYVASWREVQSRFVDDPAGALGDADGLVEQVMRDRGYPMDEFEQRAADISVDHPNVVENYRSGHAIYLANEGGEATTEDLRQAVIHYRALFEELLETREEVEEEVR